MKPGKLLPLIAAFGAGFLTALLVLKSDAGKESAKGGQAQVAVPRAAPVEGIDSKSRHRPESTKAAAPALTDAQRETKAYVAHLKSCDLSELLDEFERAIEGEGKVNTFTYMSILLDRVDETHLERFWSLLSAVKGDKSERKTMQGALLDRFGKGKDFNKMLGLITDSSRPGKERSDLIGRLFSEQAMDVAGFEEITASMQDAADVDAAISGLTRSLGGASPEVIGQFLSSGNPAYSKAAVEALPGYIIYQASSDSPPDFAWRFSTVLKLLADGDPAATKDRLSTVVDRLATTEPGIMLQAIQSKFGDGVNLDTVLNKDALQGLAICLMNRDPDAAMATFEAQPSLTGFTAAFDRWATREGPAAMDWYSAHKSTLSSGQQDVVATTYAQIAIKAGDLDTARQWAGLLSAPDAKTKVNGALNAVSQP